jgi:hypothetical protein
MFSVQKIDPSTTRRAREPAHSGSAVSFDDVGNNRNYTEVGMTRKIKYLDTENNNCYCPILNMSQAERYHVTSHHILNIMLSPIATRTVEKAFCTFTCSSNAASYRQWDQQTEKNTIPLTVSFIRKLTLITR